MGIVRDERRAFSELSTAVDHGLSESSVDLRAASGSLLPHAKVTPGLSAGLSELANCYLDGVGTKRNAERGVEYLRMAGSLGNMAVQERECCELPT